MEVLVYITSFQPPVTTLNQTNYKLSAHYQQHCVHYTDTAHTDVYIDGTGNEGYVCTGDWWTGAGTGTGSGTGTGTGTGAGVYIHVRYTTSQGVCSLWTLLDLLPGRRGNHQSFPDNSTDDVHVTVTKVLVSILHTNLSCV